jgi:GT2 family glycosyltransferase
MPIIQPKVFIVLINWNGFSDTVECISSINKIFYSNYEIIIVDNGSENDFEKLQNIYSNEIILIRSDVNLGFAGGNNLGIKYALKKNADFVLLLNNDTIVEPDFLDVLVKSGIEKEVGIIAPKILNYYFPRIIWSAGGKISWLGASGYSDGEGKTTGKFIENRYVTFVSGCCMLINKEIFSNIGFFDEDYFLYSEDTDLCKRVTDAKFKILFVADSIVYHKINTSTKRDISYLPIYYQTRNRLYFARKFYIKYLSIIMLYIYISMFLKSIIWTIMGQKNKIKAVKTAIKDFRNNNFGMKVFIC